MAPPKGVYSPHANASLYSKDIIDQAISMLKKNLSPYKIAENLGCDVSTIYRWKKQSPEFTKNKEPGPKSAPEPQELFFLDRAAQRPRECNRGVLCWVENGSSCFSRSHNCLGCGGKPLIHPRKSKRKLSKTMIINNRATMVKK